MVENIKQLFLRIFCSHNESFSFRKYNDFDFKEYCKCTRCGKTLDIISGFDEDLRG
ncbi:MAG: hypothetical protein ACPKPY_06460 [Nitrososphaeraceae archaeon]